MKLREEQEINKEADNRLQKMKDKLTGKGSAMATERIQLEYKGLIKSSDFKSIIAIDMKNDNLYNWIVTFDITKYEIGNELKADYKKLA